MKNPRIICLIILLICAGIFTWIQLKNRLTCSIEVVEYLQKWDAIPDSSVKDEVACIPEFFGDPIAPGKKATGIQRKSLESLYAKIHTLAGEPIPAKNITHAQKIVLSGNQYIRLTEEKMAVARFLSNIAEFFITQEDSLEAIHYLSKIEQLMAASLSNRDHELISWRIGFICFRTSHRISSTMTLSDAELYRIGGILEKCQKNLLANEYIKNSEAANATKKLEALLRCARTTIATKLYERKYNKFLSSFNDLAPEFLDDQEICRECTFLFKIK